MPANASIVINSGTAGEAAIDLPINTVVNLSNYSDTGVVSYQWVIVSQPEGAPQVNLEPHIDPPIVSTEPACSFTPTKEGSYLIRLTVNEGEPDESTDTTICAVRELQTGDRIPAPQETTEVNADDGWAPGAVTKILQRVTRLEDAGIFVAQNDSGGTLEIGHVVHMNGMTEIGTGDNARKIPTVGKAIATDLNTVDGPLGVVVATVAGELLPTLSGSLCRVMVMGGFASYTLPGTPGAGDPLFVGNDGRLSTDAGDYVRQVGDVAKDNGDGTFDIAISAGANSIPRGNAGGDLTGLYPDPTVAKINGTSVSEGGNLGAVLQMVDANEAGWGPVLLANTEAVSGTLRVQNGGTGSALTTFAQGGVVYANTTSSMGVTAAAAGAGYFLTSGPSGTGAPTWTQTVPVSAGGTGLAGGYTVGAMLYANGAASLTYLEPTAAGTRGILQSKGDGSAPVWIVNGTSGHPLISKGSGTDAVFEQMNLATSAGLTGTLSVDRGGTGQSSALTQYGAVYAASTTAMATTAAGTAGQPLLAAGPSAAPSFGALNLGTAAAVTGTLPVNRGGTGNSLGAMSTGGIVYASSTSAMSVTGAGNLGEILTSRGYFAEPPQWISLPDLFNEYYGDSFITSTASYSTTGGAYTQIVALTNCDLEIGNITVSCVPIADGLPFSNTITTASNGAATTVSLKYVVTGPVGFGTKNYIYQFRSSTAHNNNQVTGSITFPTFTFRATVQGDYDVALQATVTAGDTFQVLNLAMRVTQG